MARKDHHQTTQLLIYNLPLRSMDLFGAIATKLMDTEYVPIQEVWCTAWNDNKKASMQQTSISEYLALEKVNRVPFTHALQSWTFLDIPRRSCIEEHKCPNQLNWTLNGLYPASYLVQSLSNVRLSPFGNRASHCPDISQQASGHVDDVSIMQTSEGEEEGSFTQRRQ